MRPQPRAVLYLTYDGLLDPLGQSQIVPYLERFARQGLSVTVVSFERLARRSEEGCLRDRLHAQAIRWVALRYHKSPPVLSTAWDVCRGVLEVTRLCQSSCPDVVHARSYVAGLLALWAKRLTGAKFLFDIRGFWPEERVEGGLWKPNGWLFRAAKWWERRLFEASDGVVILAERCRYILQARLAAWGLRIPMVVIPTCADLVKFSPVALPVDAPVRLVYVGSVGTWYLLREMADFFRIFRERVPGATWLILTNRPDAQLQRELRDLEPGSYEVRMLPHDRVGELLQTAQASLCFIKPVSSKLACCPTKVGESLACGLPVVITEGTGDCDRLVEQERVGVVIREHTRRSYSQAVDRLLELLAEGSELSQRCRLVAERQFALDRGIEQYLSLYERLTGRDEGMPRVQTSNATYGAGACLANTTRTPENAVTS